MSLWEWLTGRAIVAGIVLQPPPPRRGPRAIHPPFQSPRKLHRNVTDDARPVRGFRERGEERIIIVHLWSSFKMEDRGNWEFLLVSYIAFLEIRIYVVVWYKSWVFLILLGAEDECGLGEGNSFFFFREGIKKRGRDRVTRQGWIRECATGIKCLPHW